MINFDYYNTNNNNVQNTFHEQLTPPSSFFVIPNPLSGRRDIKTEYDEVFERRRAATQRVKDIRDKYFDHRQMGNRDQRRLREAEETEALLRAQENELEARKDSCFRTCLRCCRPLRVLLGLLFLLVSLTIAASLVIGNVDKALHSLGPRMGYALPQRTLPNPVDIVLQYAQRVFPLDYVIILVLVLYLFLASMAGIREIGVWCLCIRAYKVMRKGLVVVKYPSVSLFVRPLTKKKAKTKNKDHRLLIFFVFRPKPPKKATSIFSHLSYFEFYI